MNYDIIDRILIEVDEALKRTHNFKNLETDDIITLERIIDNLDNIIIILREHLDNDIRK